MMDSDCVADVRGAVQRGCHSSVVADQGFSGAGVLDWRERMRFRRKGSWASPRKMAA